MKKRRLKWMALMAAMVLMVSTVMAQAIWLGYSDVSGSNFYSYIRDAKSENNKVNVGVENTFIIDAGLFTFLKDYPDVTMELEGESFRIYFKGDNMGTWSDNAYAKLIYDPAPKFKEEAKKLCGNKRLQAFSVDVTNSFPSTAVFQLKSYFAPGKRVNIYTYNETDKTTAAYMTNVEIGSAGMLNLSVPPNGNYIITPEGIGDVPAASDFTETPKLNGAVSAALNERTFPERVISFNR